MPNLAASPGGDRARDQHPGNQARPHIIRAGAEQLDRVEPIWRALAEHIATFGATIGPPLPPEESWRRAREFQGGQLRKPGSFLLLAERDSQVIGYALVVIDTRPSLTWDLSHRRASLDQLCVLPGDRGHGVGSALIVAAKDALRAAGLDRMSLSVLAADERTHRFYQRHEFSLELLQMTARL